ncbi:hypothetical protein WR25_21652 [Diploscapter pachys]|uniref:Receptor expression-enhancing protein n=1 Tax=Diploscapter pachys TaxID=2018661 RepID=A0A2A2K8I3_9BILA|nr:hypothetical protein WR25_21652 [Diploscapter pachys]
MAPPQVQKIMDDIDKQLHEPGPITNVLQTAEQKTGLRRLHIVLGIAGLQALYLIFGHFAELVCNFMGFIYPAYVSIRAIESHSKDDDTQWLTYWVVFAVLSVLEFFSQQILAIFPIYWLFKAVFLLYLYLPSTQGATKLYNRFLKPFAVKHHGGSVDQHIRNVADKVDNAAHNFANQARNMMD